MKPISSWGGRRFVVALLLVSLTGCAGSQAGSSPTGNSASVPAGAQATTSGVCSGRPTPAQTEGPYFKAGAPQSTSLLEPGITGVHLLLTGRVLSASCTPIKGARIEFWQADSAGVYDNSGYRLRGQQVTDAAGSYSLQTVIPGLYPGRTSHIHVKVSAPGKPVLTTQLYFPGQSRNQQDGIFNPELLMEVRDGADGRAATFDFIIA